MLRYILFDLRLFDSESGRESSQKGLLWLLESLSNWNVIFLRDHPNTPKMYDLHKRGLIKYKVPEQFEVVDVPAVGVLHKALKKGKANKEAFAALAQVANMCGGGEHFRDIPSVIENGGGDCFPLAQRIIVRSKSTGMYEILSIGDLRFAYPAYEALSYNFSSLRYEFKDITGFVDKGIKPVSKARLSNGTDLIATDDHVFWTVDGSGGNRRRVGQRTMGEYVEAMKMTADRRTPRSRIVQAAHIPALGVCKPSRAQAYLAGMYAAEGEFSDGKHTRIGQHRPAVRQKIEEALVAESTGFHYAPGRGRTPGSGAQYSLHGGSANHLVSMMRGQGGNSFEKRLPRSFLSGDEQTVAMLLEGHGDGDAWRPANGNYKRPNIDAIYATSSDELMEQLRLGALILGRRTYAYQYQDHQGAGHSPIWRLHEYNEKATKLLSRQKLVEDLLPGLTYGTVRSAEPFGTAHVGCIEVEGNHNFFLADGTLVKNCDNLAAWRVAELRVAGINAQPYITWRRRVDGGMTYHALVRWPDGSSEDPSLILGMGGPSREKDRQEELRKNAERHEMAEAAFRAAKDPKPAPGADHEHGVDWGGGR